MNGYEFATRVNTVTKANREQKISAQQAETILEALEKDDHLAGDLGKHLYGDLPPQPAPEPPQEQREILDIKDAANA